MDVKTLCLAVLSHGPASGYEIKKTLEEGPYAYFYRASFGSIYPALARLLGAGLVTVQAETQDRRPDKKIYHLTAEGRRALIDALHGHPAPDYIRSDFVLMMFHADLLDERRRRELIDNRIAWLKQALACVTEDITSDKAKERPYAGIGPDFVSGLGRAVYAAELGFLEEYRDRVIGAGQMAPAAASAEE
ncbi:MAG TPA: PadR family transcriptional regulator [Alphaproteobacteria bacterium]